jgi:protein disulfide-isomerase A1
LDSNNRASFKIIDEYVFIAYLAPDDTASKSLFESLAARNHHRFSFGLASDVRLAKAENVPVPSIVAYHQSEGGKEILSGDWQLKTLADFVERTTAPLIGELTRRNELKYLQAGKSLLYIFASASSERSHYQDMLKPLAKKYKDYINFVTIDAMEYAHMAPGLGLKDDSFPAVALLNPMFGQVFPFQAEKSGKEISLEVLEGWVLDIVGGKVKPWTSSNADGGNEGLRRDEL